MYTTSLISCTTLLTQRNIYLIDGTLYRYLWVSDSIKYTQYFFRPLAGQRKKADLRLNRDKVLLRVYEVPALRGQLMARITEKAIQLSLF
ncbi:hypothetical protein SD81_016965 [Tolypothrix campylonemoides VB511288]|nr:hypothetical protein SD81_016965 [Tolypothrix campylonemoides VB511288]